MIDFPTAKLIFWGVVVSRVIRGGPCPQQVYGKIKLKAENRKQKAVSEHKEVVETLFVFGVRLFMSIHPVRNNACCFAAGLHFRTIHPGQFRVATTGISNGVHSFQI